MSLQDKSVPVRSIALPRDAVVFVKGERRPKKRRRIDDRKAVFEERPVDRYAGLKLALVFLLPLIALFAWSGWAG